MYQDSQTATRARSAELTGRLPAVRRELNRQRRFRLEQLEELAADAAEAVATVDDARLQVSRVPKLAAESALSEIEGALQRIALGTYGSCERCAQPIPWERLEVLPMTALCTRCQWLTEFERGPRTRSRTSSVRQGRRRES